MPDYTPDSTVDIVDESCDCIKCQAQSDEFYFLSATCSVCGHAYVTKHRCGDKPGLYTECPHCKVSDYGVHRGTWQEAERLLTPRRSDDA